MNAIRRERLYEEVLAMMCEGMIAAIRDDDLYLDRPELVTHRKTMINAIGAAMWFIANAREDIDEIHDAVELERDLLALGVPADPPERLPTWPPASRRRRVPLSVTFPASVSPTGARSSKRRASSRSTTATNETVMSPSSPRR